MREKSEEQGKQTEERDKSNMMEIRECCIWQRSQKALFGILLGILSRFCLVNSSLLLYAVVKSGDFGAQELVSSPCCPWLCGKSGIAHSPLLLSLQ